MGRPDTAATAISPGVVVSRETDLPPPDAIFRSGRAGSTGKPGLLDELDDIRSLLGDALDDVSAGLPGDLDIPLLEPDSPPDAPPAATPRPRTAPSGQHVAKAPGAPSSSTVPASKTAAANPLQELLSARENPFLPRHTMERLAQHRAHTPEGLRPSTPAAAEKPPTSAAAQVSQSTPRRPDDATIRAAVDEILAVWMPRIERELRDRLTQQMRDRDDA